MSRTLLIAFAAAALLLPLVSSVPAHAARQLKVRVSVTSRAPEPGDTLTVRVRARDQRGRVIRGVKCVFLWHQQASTPRATRYTNRGGYARSRRVIRGFDGGVRVPVTVKCTWRKQTRRVRTWFVPAKALPPVPKLVFVGDSLSAGFYATTEAHSFRGLVLSHAGNPPNALLGVHGWESDDIDLTRLAEEAGDIVVVELGTNDAVGGGGPVAPGVFAANLRAIAVAARAGNHDCRLVFVSVWQDDPVRTPYDRAIRGVAAKYGRHFIDIAAIKDDRNHSMPRGIETYVGRSDGWHPNDAGHAAIAGLISEEITKMMSQNSGGTR